MIDVGDGLGVHTLDSPADGKPGLSRIRRTIVTAELIVGVGFHGIDVWDRRTRAWVEFEPFSG